MGTLYVYHIWWATFNSHLNNCVIVFENYDIRSWARRLDSRRHTIHIERILYILNTPIFGRWRLCFLWLPQRSFIRSECFRLFISRQNSPSGALPKLLNLEIAKIQKSLDADPPDMHAKTFFWGHRAGVCAIAIEASRSCRYTWALFQFFFGVAKNPTAPAVEKLSNFKIAKIQPSALRAAVSKFLNFKIAKIQHNAAWSWFILILLKLYNSWSTLLN